MTVYLKQLRVKSNEPRIEIQLQDRRDKGYYLLMFAFSKEMCLPILLMIGKSRLSMLELMVFIKDNNPTEHEIVLKAIELEGHTSNGIR